MTGDVTILYHGGGCRDGFCAAWVMKQLFPDAQFLPVNYGESMPTVSGRRVFIVDFCPNTAAELIQLVHDNESVFVMDHHQTAESVIIEVGSWPYERSNSQRHKFGFRFDKDKSGARLAWEYAASVAKWHDIGLPPWTVEYVEDRDLWRWALPDSRAINAALRLSPLDFGTWDGLAMLNPESLIERGRAVLDRDAEIVADHVARAVPVWVGDRLIPCVNATVLMSEIGHELSKGHPFSATYFDDLKAGTRRWSLRSQPDGEDVGAVAKAMGGGGHKHAAGFQTPLDLARRA